MKTEDGITPDDTPLSDADRKLQSGRRKVLGKLVYTAPVIATIAMTGAKDASAFNNPPLPPTPFGGGS